MVGPAVLFTTVKKLPRSFYTRSTLAVARDLLGKILVRKERNGTRAGRIVEVEAYLGQRDPASHAYRGRTARNDVMFWTGGHLYVYFTYGMHFCANVVTGKEGDGTAVLIRALEPLRGIRAMARCRHLSPADLHALCSGPAKFCEAFQIGRRENGIDLCGTFIWIAEEKGAAPVGNIRRSARIGITSGTEHRWRFFVADSPFLSRA